MKKFNFGIIGKFFVLLFLLSIYIMFSAYSYASSVSSGISDSVFRLHVIANSDSAEDQSLKYKVRDSLLDYMNSLCSFTSSKQEAIEIAQNHIDDFYRIAQEVVNENGYDYPINITIGKYDFPTKQYGDVSLPAGIYDALRVEIGSASGQNWWCVMFPPLCFVDVSSGVVPDSSKETLQDNMSSEEYNLITDSDNNSELNVKFKIVELLENLKIKLANN
ncbi:MAG: stage II sporulation protein R [Clostridia bacterium]